MIPESSRWEYRKSDSQEVRRLAAETGYPEIFAGLLAARGIKNKAEAEKFLHAGEGDMYDPFLMKGMTEAAKRISRAVDSHEKITIYGDYDVDGITATSILYLFLESLGAHVNYYLPDRMAEGYGLNEGAVRRLAGEGTKLMVTVDTGISAIKECDLAAELGMDMIITDHHECQEILPKALAVIDAKQPGESYPFHFLAGCGVAYKLVQALARYRKYEGNISKYLELAAVGTVADLVPLYDENRIIVREGFKRMKNPENMGLRKLLESADYDFKRPITSNFVGFGIGPRLNAGGRMGDAGRGVRLFITEDEAEAAHIAETLNGENTHRKETEQLILQQVMDRIEASPEIRSSRVMVVAGEDWHHGVIGIVSSRIKDMYYRPNILLSVSDGIAVGSARSVEGFHLFEALCSCSDLMIKFGGHEAAAGLTLKAENIPELCRRINDYARVHMDGRMLTPVLHPEVLLKPSAATTELIELIEEMEPFGQGMEEPLAEIGGMLTEVRAVGADGNTLRMKLSDERGTLTAVGFRRGVLNHFYSSGMKVSIVGNLGINLYMDRKYPQIILKDVHVRQAEETALLLESFALRHVTEDYRNYCDTQEKLPGDTCQRVYRFLTAQARRQGTPDEGYLLIHEISLDGSLRTEGHLYMLLQGLAVFEELGLMQAEISGSCLYYQFIRGKTAKLADSSWYMKYFAGRS